jgi:hypothetical protein
MISRRSFAYSSMMCRNSVDCDNLVFAASLSWVGFSSDDLESFRRECYPSRELRQERTADQQGRSATKFDHSDYPGGLAAIDHDRRSHLVRFDLGQSLGSSAQIGRQQ